MGAYRYPFYMIGILGTAVVLSQFYNVLVSGVFWLFYAAVIFPLAIGTLQFALTILLPCCLQPADELRGIRVPPGGSVGIATVSCHPTLQMVGRVGILTARHCVKKDLRWARKANR